MIDLVYNNLLKLTDVFYIKMIFQINLQYNRGLCYIELKYYYFITASFIISLKLLLPKVVQICVNFT